MTESNCKIERFNPVLCCGSVRRCSFFSIYQTKTCDRIDEGGKKTQLGRLSKSCTLKQTGYIHQTAFSSQPNLTETGCNAVTSL